MNGHWFPGWYLKASDNGPNQGFGFALGMDEGRVVVGTEPHGFTYVFDVEPFGALAVPRTAGTNVSSYTTTLPVLGQPLACTVDLTTTGHSLALVVGFLSPANVPLPSGEVLLVGPSFPLGEVLALSPQPGPSASFNVAIPGDPTLCGLEVFTQAVHFGGVFPLALSNAVDLTLGYWIRPFLAQKRLAPDTVEWR